MLFKSYTRTLGGDAVCWLGPYYFYDCYDDGDGGDDDDEEGCC